MLSPQGISVASSPALIHFMKKEKHGLLLHKSLFPDLEDPWESYEKLERVAADLVADIWDHIEECLR